MTRKEAKQLQSGDEVYWRDPDEGKCSRVITIAGIEIKGDVAVIREENGEVFECFLSELE